MQKLLPRVELLTEEYVLVQAWKKASAHIRYHNWFSDTLALDLAAADLPRFISKISKKLQSGSYEPTPLKLVPAPKSQKWHVKSDGVWEPVKNRSAKIRPLAHVSLEDQVAATAVLLCLSDRAETAQCDPRGNYRCPVIRKSLMSYGNRLFCDLDENNNALIHRWGSSKLYRSYFEDYRTFLKRPEAVASSMQSHDGVLILQTDLSQFYDRVQPAQLIDSIRNLQTKDDDEEFYVTAKNLLNWSWSTSSQKHYEQYLRQSEITNFDGVALPQGLVSAGFFANVLMLDFDNAVLLKMDQEIAPGIVLQDACRYVDDVRITISTSLDLEIEKAQEISMRWLGDVLAKHCPGQQFSVEKTMTTSLDNSLGPLVRQSRKMERIQKAISGGFDATGGEEVIQALEALVRTQNNLADSNALSQITALRAAPDVNDGTVNRFAVGRFRKTFRSLRLLLDHRPDPSGEEGVDAFEGRQLSKQELDDDAHTFAVTLVNKWIEDPSNVRLLRIALDLWPSIQLLEQILKLIDPYLRGIIKNFVQRRIALYCLAEILRAGTIETGFVDDSDCLPHSVDISTYRELLLSAAKFVLSKDSFAPPWYVKQQALLYLATHNPSAIIAIQKPLVDTNYWKLIAFLNGNYEGLSDRSFAKLAIVVRRSFTSQRVALKLVAKAMTSGRHLEIAKRDLEFAKELIREGASDFNVHVSVLDDIGANGSASTFWSQSLHSLVMECGKLNILRNEIGVLSFAERFLKIKTIANLPDIITPSAVQVQTSSLGNYEEVTSISFNPRSSASGYGSIYSVPSWADRDQRWRFQLGYLLRFILTAQVDFSFPVQRPSWKETELLYRPTRGHWLQRQYGYYSGHEAFGDDWLPISQNTQDLLFSLLVWPGCRAPGLEGHHVSLHEIALKIDTALSEAKKAIGPATQTLMLTVNAPIPWANKDGRPPRACIVQSMMPECRDFRAHDLVLMDPAIRKKHRQHLLTALSAVKKMLDLRETHKPVKKRLDWLIFPELAVHPADVQYLLPFARAFKTIILTGICYEQLIPNQHLVNSALWVIPHKVPGRGLQILTRRQGKQNLSRMEDKINNPIQKISGFRPAQWLVGYEWSGKVKSDPLWLTASICYDATDLKLASDLRSRSDVYAIPALNQDVGTFDQMALALNYHMYQLVMIANNGAYGGSNAHWPVNQHSTVTHFSRPTVTHLQEGDRWGGAAGPARRDDPSQSFLCGSSLVAFPSLPDEKEFLQSEGRVKFR